MAMQLTTENLLLFEGELDEAAKDGQVTPEAEGPKMNNVSRGQISGFKSAVTKAITKLSQAVSNDRSEMEIKQFENDVMNRQEKVIMALEIYGKEKGAEERMLIEIQSYEEKVELELTRIREIREASVIGSSVSRQSRHVTTKINQTTPGHRLHMPEPPPAQATPGHGLHMPEPPPAQTTPGHGLHVPEPPPAQGTQGQGLHRECAPGAIPPQLRWILEGENTPGSVNTPPVAPQQNLQPVMSMSYRPSPGNNLGLSRINLEKFDGQLKEYRGWRAAFNIAVHRTHLHPEEKMLRLRGAMAGKAKSLIEDLQNFTEQEYEEALRRLDREFGTAQREGARLLENINKFPAIRDWKDKLEKLKDLLNTLNTTIAFFESENRQEELGDGMMYTIVKSKLPEHELFLYEQQLQGKKRTLLNLRDWLKELVETKTLVRESVYGVESTNTYSSKRHETFSRAGPGMPGSRRPAAVHATIGTTQDCPVCRKHGHETKDCYKFKKMPLSCKWREVKNKGLCRVCLEPGHLGSNCKQASKTQGDDCPNHQLLQKDREREPEKWKPKQNNQSTWSKAKNYGEKPKPREEGNNRSGEQENKAEKGRVTANVGGYVSLRTIPVILSHGNRSLETIAMLDDGSTETYLLEDIAHELNLPALKRSTKRSVVFGDKEVAYQTRKVENLEIQGVGGGEKIVIPNLWTHPTLVGKATVINWQEASSEWDHLKDIPFPTQPKKKKVGILLGNSYPYVHMSLKEIRAKSSQENLPIARLTPLGWTCIGPARRDYHEEGNDATTSCMTFNTQMKTYEPESQLNEIVPKIWELETIGLGPPTAQEKSKIGTSLEKKAEEKVMNSLTFKDGYYEVGTPWKEDRPTLPENLQTVVRRQEKMENSIKRKDPELYQKCDEVIKAQVKKGYLKELGTVEDAPKDGFYIPVFPVRDENRQTTKVRMVLDCAAKFDGVSLNDAILPGPKLIKELVDVLLRFRRYPYAITGDISEMFLQIRLRPEDQMFYRMVWGGMAYEYERTVFGDCSSPFKANKVVQEHNRKHREKYPQAADTLENSIYVDDTLDSRCEVEELITTRRELSGSLEEAGWKIRKFLSNVKEALEEIPNSDKAAIVNIEGIPSLPSQKTLGMMWEAEADIFNYQYAVDLTKKVVTMTKRGILKIMATLFDPLGLLDPFRIRAWMYFQETWIRKLDWDAELDEDLQRKWKAWLQELGQLKSVRIERHIGMHRDLYTELHVFSDASKEAFGATVYARTEMSDGTKVSRLVIAKTRVSPLKAISIAKLELCGTV